MKKKNIVIIAVIIFACAWITQLLSCSVHKEYNSVNAQDGYDVENSNLEDKDGTVEESSSLEDKDGIEADDPSLEDGDGIKADDPSLEDRDGIEMKETDSAGEHSFDGTIIIADKNFEVYEITKDNQPEYRYIIYNSYGEIVRDETVWRTQPHITYIFNDTLLSIYRGVGTGTYLVQYYDINKDIFSEIFMSVLLEGYGRIAYIIVTNGKYELVIRDVFDETLFCQRFELDFSSIGNPVDGVRCIAFCSEDTIRITYLSGAEYDEKTEIINLR